MRVWILYLGSVFGVMFLLLALPYHLRGWLLLGMLCLSLIFGFARSSADLKLNWRQPYRKFKQLLQVPRFRSYTTLVMVLAGAACMILAAYYFLLLPVPIHHSIPVNSQSAMYFVLVGTGLLGLALRLYRTEDEPPASSTEDATHPVRLWLLLWGIALLAVLTQANVLHTDVDALPIISRLVYLPHHTQILGWLMGIVLVTWGLSGWRFQPKMLDRLHLKRHHLWLLLIVILGLVLRSWNLDEALHLFLDEVPFGKAVADLRDMDTTPILTPFGGVTAFSWLFPYMQFWVVKVIGPSLESLRIVSAGWGTAHIIAVYFLGKTLFDRKTAMVAALILATFPPHIHFSRIGLNNIADPVVGTLALAFLLRGLRRGRQLDFALAGTMLGLTHYFYEGGRLFFTLFTLCWIAWITFFGKQEPLRARVDARKLVIMLVALILTITPLYFTWWAHEKPFFPRFDAVSSVNTSLPVALNHQPSLQIERIIVPLQGFVHLPDNSPFYAGKTAMILVYLVPLFLIGSAVAFWKLRSAQGILFWWVIATAVGNSFITNNLTMTRYLVVFPAVAVLIAAGLRYLLLLLTRQRWQRSLQIAGMITVLGIGFYQTDYYFRIHLPEYHRFAFAERVGFRGLVTQDFDDMLFRSVTLPPDTDVHVITRNHRGPGGFSAALDFWGRREDMRIELLSPYDLSDRFLWSLPRPRNRAFFLEPDDERSLARLREHFTLDEVQYSPHNLPRDRQFVLYFAPRLQNIIPLKPPDNS